MATTPKDVVKLVQDNNVKMIDFKFVDLPGVWQHYSIPAHRLDESLFEDGIGFDGSTIRGFTISFNKHRLQIPPGPLRQSFAKAKVELRHHLDGSLAICYQGQSLVTFQPAAPAPSRVGHFQPAPPASPPSEPHKAKLPNQPRRPWKPPADHPWRKPLVAKEKK